MSTTRGSVRYPVDQLAPLSLIAEEKDIPIDLLRRWADADRRNDFPKPVEHLGRVRFFLRADVDRWITMWQMTAKGRKGE